MSTRYFSIGLLIASSFTVCSSYADTLNERTITVQGNGEVRVAPNIATLQIAVETNASQANEAVQKNAEQMTQMVNALKKNLGKQDQLSTSQYNLNPVYQYDQPTQKSILTGYQVTNYVVVTTQQLDTLGQLLDSTAQAGANRIESLQFSHDKIAEYQQQALAQAVIDTQQTAQILAKSAGVQLGPVLQIQPQQNQAVPMVSMEMSKSGRRASTPIEPGQLAVNMSVVVVYNIKE